MTEPSLAITTAADRQFLWGLYLLAATLRRHGVTVPLHYMTVGLSDDEIQLLSQFGPINIVNKETYRHAGNALTLSKPDALDLGWDSEVVWWMDADCIVTGDVSQYLTPKVPSFHARFREPAENRVRFDTVGGDGGIPAQVLDVWRRDVDQRKEARMATTCSANAFAIHRDYRSFVELWRNQVEFLLKKHRRGSAEQSIAYRFRNGFSDEMILNSLLVFAHDTPPFTQYQMDRDPHAMLVHFALNPKPWVKWTADYLKHYETVVSTIEWADSCALRTPPVPEHFKRVNRDRVIRATRLRGVYQTARRYVRRPGRYLKDIVAAHRIRTHRSE